jgi:hypothetical protein
MKSQTFIALAFLALLVCSHAIQIKDHATETRRRRNGHRMRKALSKNKASTQFFTELYDALKSVLNKNDFKFNLGAKLNVLEYELPVTVSLFYNQGTGTGSDHYEGWDISFKPSSLSDIESAIPSDKRAGKTVTETVAGIVTEFAWAVAKGFIKDLIVQAAKAAIVALFPPIAPVFVVWALISDSSVIFEQDEDNKDLYELGYAYQIAGNDDVNVELFVSVIVNLGKLKEFFGTYVAKVEKFINDNFGTLASEIKAIYTKASALAAEIKQNFEDAEKAIKEAIARKVGEVATKVVNFVTSYIPAGVRQVASTLATYAQAAIENLFTRIRSHVRSTVTAIANGLSTALHTVKDWVSRATSKVKRFFKSLFSRLARGKVSYKRALRMMNRRLFRNARRAHRSSKY